MYVYFAQYLKTGERNMKRFAALLAIVCVLALTVSCAKKEEAVQKVEQAVEESAPAVEATAEAVADSVKEVTEEDAEAVIPVPEGE